MRKQIVLLQRFARRDNSEAVLARAEQMNGLLVMLADCGTRDELMGIEGAAAREYFAALEQIVPADMQFTGRSRQPPADVINAALSYGYAIILGETVSALCAAGLDPAIGFLHAEQDRRPSLALDLMEEFRPLVVDQVVIAAARRGELRPEHGRREETGHATRRMETTRAARTRRWVRSQTRSRHKAYGNPTSDVEQLERARPKQGHATRRMETPYTFAASSPIGRGPKQGHAIRRMATFFRRR